MDPIVMDRPSPEDAAELMAKHNGRSVALDEGAFRLVVAGDRTLCAEEFRMLYEVLYLLANGCPSPKCACALDAPSDAP